ncbi:hypothetical protein E1193_18070 [Micromonospora sp. KC606]|uniref:hypothetical protein n=1 Tax=Micromonospora sp. KC606 TaxID=2530379 RepID=UPI001043B151|nr:hypothetical protein [Micromonospora sp. KC606]TDC80066.1 hypothetical protein E1193_18070 [Micromonospora sp. KC606]
MRRAKTWRPATAAAAMLLATAGTVAVTASPAAAATTISGRITCGANSQGRVVGMWVSTNAGGNGWASWSATSDPMIANYSKAIPSNATSVSVAVGCGGSPSSWARTYYGSTRVSSGGGAAYKDWICYTYGADVCV